MCSFFLSVSAINLLHVLCKISHVSIVKLLNLLKIHSLQHAVLLAVLLEHNVKQCSLEKAVVTKGRKYDASKYLTVFKLAGLLVKVQGWDFT